MVIPNLAPIPCPYCTNVLILIPGAQLIGFQAAPFFWRCKTRGCDTQISAHPDGRPMGIPGNRAVRAARKDCHTVFDRLWRNSFKLPQHAKAFRNPNQIDNKRAQTSIRKAARDKAYLYMAHHLGLDPRAVHIGQITDLGTLSLFHAVASEATPKRVFNWWKEEGSKLYDLRQGGNSLDE